MVTELVNFIKAGWDLIKAGVKALVKAFGVFFGTLIDWFNRAMNYIEEKLHVVVEGTEIMLKKIGEGFQEISEHYSKKGNQWTKNTIVKSTILSENEIPADILETARIAENGSCIDISKQTEELVLTAGNR